MNAVIALPAGAVTVLVGVLVLRARQLRIGCLLIAHGVCFAVLLTFSAESTTGGGLVIDQLLAGSWVFLFLWLVLIAYLLPDGHTASTFWRRWVQIGLLGVLAFLLGAAGDTAGFQDAHHGVEPPLPWLPPPVSELIGVLGLVVTIALFAGCAFAVASRMRHGTHDTRVRLSWLVWGATSLPAALVLEWVGHFLLDDSATVEDGAILLAGLGLPLAIGVAVLRYRLFDIQLVLSRTLTYGALVVGTVAVYALLLFGADRLVGDSTAGGLLAVGIVAVAVNPAYALLRKRIEHHVYGYRSDPAAALRRLGTRVESADALPVVDVISVAVAEALKAERAWVEVAGTHVDNDPRAIRVALLHRGDRIGDLAVVPPAGRTLSAADLALLRDLATQAAVTVRAAQLAVDLQASRARIVTAREEERKRLRRDLHDGVGPSLAAILLMLQAIGTRHDEDERHALLVEVRNETRAAITEVRRAVDDLRPPAIDEVGLMGAIRQRAATLSSPRLQYGVRGPEVLPSLPAAVEVAAFRIVSEAMTNVAKHSSATVCTVELDMDAALDVTVTDNGPASASPARTGVGWASMVERAAELGGTCTISLPTDGGVLVHAVLPVLEPVSADLGVPA